MTIKSTFETASFLMINTDFMRNRLFLIIGIQLFIRITILCQCPTLTFSKTSFNTIYNDAAKTPAIKLKELLQLNRQMQHCHYEKDSTYTLLLQKIGLLYSKQSDFLNAVAYTKKSIDNARSPYPGQATYDSAIVKSYYNLNFYYSSLNQTKNVYDCIDSCIAYSIKKNTAYDIASLALGKKASCLFDKGDYSLCTSNALVGEGIMKNYYHGRDSISLAAYFITVEMNPLYFSHKIPVLEKLLKASEKDFESTGNTNYLNGVYGMLGQINVDRNDFKSALFYFTKAYQANIFLQYREGISQELRNLGILHAKGFLQYDKALNYCDSALKYADGTPDSLAAFHEIANIYGLKGMYNKAQYFYQQAFDIVEKGSDEQSLANSTLQFNGFNIYQDILDLITDKGNAYQQQFQATKNKEWLSAAIKVFKNGDLFLTRLKAQQALQFESNLVWRASAHNLYEHAAEACYAGNDIENAFYFFEKSRAVLLNDQINEQRILSQTDIVKAAKLDQEINQLNIDVQATEDRSVSHLELLKKLYLKSAERESLTHQLNQKEISAAKNIADTVSITIQQARKEILKDGSLLEIFTGDSAVYMLTITPKTQMLQRLNKTVYDSLTRSFISFVSHPAIFEKDFNNYVQTAHQLYSFIFKNNSPPEGRIIISPDASFFPFEALVTDENNMRPRYFLEKYITSYAYSARYLSNATSSVSYEGNSLLGIAPVTFNTGLHLASLPGSDVSLQHIKTYFSNTSNMVNGQATKAVFLQQFPRYNIIQLYTHAADSSFRNDPVIYFADSALYLSQLTSAQKPIAQLIVLSACETANGNVYQGEGVFSFNRSFAALGIPAAISNLWSVDNQSTYTLTELFYKYLAQGLQTDLALQKAKLEFINTSPKEKQFPYYWAATILVGKNIIVTAPENNHTYLIVLFILFLMALVFFTTRKYVLQNNKKK